MNFFRFWQLSLCTSWTIFTEIWSQITFYLIAKVTLSSLTLDFASILRSDLENSSSKGKLKSLCLKLPAKEFWIRSQLLTKETVRYFEYCKEQTINCDSCLACLFNCGNSWLYRTRSVRPERIHRNRGLVVVGSDSVWNVGGLSTFLLRRSFSDLPKNSALEKNLGDSSWSESQSCCSWSLEKNDLWCQ